MKITVTPASPEQQREKPGDESALGFGKFFSDHMFIMRYREGTGWHNPRIVPYEPLPIDPAAMVLHYGQEIFEGLKSYRGRGGAVCLFRLEKNFERLNLSARRLCMPQIPVEDALEAVTALLRVDRGCGSPPRAARRSTSARR